MICSGPGRIACAAGPKRAAWRFIVCAACTSSIWM